MTRSRSVLCSKIFAGSSLILAMIGVSACTSTPGAQSLAVSSLPYTPVPVAYNTPTREAEVEPARTAETGQGDLMPIGGVVPAPMGFLDLCQRSPSDCSHSSDFDPIRIRTLARAATAERYRLAFASLHQNAQVDPNSGVQSAAVSPPADGNAPAATDDGARYLNWPVQTTGPVSYVQPLPHPFAPASIPGRLSLPGLVAPAANGYVSDFLDLSVSPGGWTQLGAAAPAPLSSPVVTAPLLAGDVQPGAIADGSDSGAMLNWNNKSGGATYLAVVPVSAIDTHAPSIQYDMPTEPYDWAHVHVPAGPAAPLPQLQARIKTVPDQAEVASDRALAGIGNRPSSYVRIDMNGRNAEIVRSVNDEVNRIMRGATDEEVYHVADYWNAPALVRGVRGDCEDFALEKRRLLIENGIPAAALSIAIVQTRRGEDHAVLIVSAAQGDFVLDNLQYDVRQWRKADYTWISRQGPGDDLAWVSLAPANTRARSPWQAHTLRVAYAQ